MLFNWDESSDFRCCTWPGSLFLDGVFQQKGLLQCFSAMCMPFIILITMIIIIIIIIMVIKYATKDYQKYKKIKDTLVTSFATRAFLTQSKMKKSKLL